MNDLKSMAQDHPSLLFQIGRKDENHWHHSLDTWKNAVSMVNDAPGRDILAVNIIKADTNLKMHEL